MPSPILGDQIAGLPGVAHGFFTRHGGVSQGIYASLNCGIGSRDDQACVQHNRARVVSHLGAQDIISAYQVHGTTALIVQGAWQAGERPRADALVTNTPGVAVGALTADCAPVLFADAQARVVGAAHAGWRGALGGILEAAVAAMEGLGAKRERVHAVVGPCIGQDAYQVGPEFRDAFLKQNPANATFFTGPDAEGRPHFDLSAYIVHRLSKLRLGSAGAVNVCTFAGERDLFSYRRSRLRGEQDYGRQISAIVLT